MTTGHPPRPTRYQLRLYPPLITLAASTLLAAGCGSSSPPAATHPAAPAASAAQGGDAARETAETRLAAIGTQLGTVLTDYQNGKRQQAYDLAKSISAKLYEGTTEGIVSGVDPTGERQIDPLLAATLPGAIHNGEPASQIAALTHRGQQLAQSCLTAIHHSE